ncbi:MAG: APC family permease [Capsulimonadaceae bacterium]|nr:APC family permease [Capsulimonadaceae bacterium]
MATPTSSASGGGELKPTLGLTGVTINAMALIAPGAFLWTTFQSQCAFGASSMWASVFVATLVALATASCYAAFARKYPEAGAGSSYFYSEAAFLEQESHSRYKFARLSKLIVGIAAHLYYWVYPGVMVAFMGTILIFIGQLFNPNFATQPIEQMGLCVLFAAIVGAIAYIGVTGSTMANIVINIIQITALIVFSVAAILFRVHHPALAYEHHSALSVISPHGATQLLFQSTIAILLVVGFESATALAAESKNPKHDIPRGVILSLVIQAVIFYFFEYFAANYFIGSHYAGVIDKAGANFSLIDPKITAITDPSINQKMYAGGSIVNGYAAAGADSAPIGSFANIIGTWLFHSAKGGFYFELIIALTVVLALIGTALSCLSTGVRVTYAMGKDDELPGFFGFIHGKFNTPHVGVIILTVVSGLIGAYGVLNSDNLIKIALISNLGTFMLYGLTCLVTYIGFSGDKDAPFFSTKLIPIVGVILNTGLMLGDFYFAFAAPSATAATKYDTKCALGITVGFIILSFAYLMIRSSIRKEPMLLPPHKSDTLAGGRA